MGEQWGVKMVYQPFKHIPVNRNAQPYDLPAIPQDKFK